MKDYLNLSAIILILFILLSFDCSREEPTPVSQNNDKVIPSENLSIIPVKNYFSIIKDSDDTIEYPIHEFQINNSPRSKALYLRGIKN